MANVEAIDEDDDLFVLSVTAAAAATSRLKKRIADRSDHKRRFWIHPIQEKRTAQGDFQNLIVDLRKDPVLFRRYFRVSQPQYEKLLSLIETRIQLQNTRWRESIGPGQQLAICLRYPETYICFAMIIFKTLYYVETT